MFVYSRSDDAYIIINRRFIASHLVKLMLEMVTGGSANNSLEIFFACCI